MEDTAMAEAKAKDADGTVETVSEQRPAHWFKPGHSGNLKGRPKGARSKLDTLFVECLYRDFKDHGSDAIRRCRDEKPDVYLNVIAKVVPKQVELDATDAAVDLAKGLHAVAEFLESFAAGESSSDHARALPDGSVLPADLRPQTH